jgi:general secretion pathway protein G
MEGTQMFREVRRRRRGFSLIELLVVLVILALLAGIVLPRFLNRAKDAQVSTARTQIQSFKSALQLYMLDNNNTPPSTQQGLDALVSEPTSSPRPVKWQKYLNDITAIPMDPWGNPYEYQSPGPGGEDFFIISYGADGKEGGTNEDADITSNDTKQ